MMLAHGVKKGDFVMAVLKRHYEFWFLAYGLMKIGAILVPATCQLKKKDYVYRFDSVTCVSILSKVFGYLSISLRKSIQPSLAP